MRKKLSALALASAALIAAYQGVAKSPSPGNVSSTLGVAMPSAAGSMMGQPYLKGPPPPDSLLLSPMPPAAGSAAEARDIEAAKAALALRGTPRWALATADAELSADRPGAVFSCAAGLAIGPATTPRLNRLLFRAMADLGQSTGAIKRQYQRPRPFMVNNEPTCTPAWESLLRRDGSYPSGHSALGYGLGLILAELFPQRASQLVARGRAFGDSRRICNVHWLSDIEEGRIAAAATVARLHADPGFEADLTAARREVRAARSRPQHCDEEAAALSA